MAADGGGNVSACPACLSRALLLRNLAPNISRAVDRRAGDRARDLLALDDRALARAVTADRATARAALSDAAGDAAHGALSRRLEQEGCFSACRHDRDWPASLSRLGPAEPAALFGAGERSLLTESERAAVTLVGARRAGAYGREVAGVLGKELAATGLTVISGMAMGVDAAAHLGALEVGGPTVAILGAGPERPYPRSARRLHLELRDRGLVVSELPPDSGTFRWCFPARNRIMAALGDATVVVEAADRSGSLITAEMAGDCGRMVGAVPGPVTSWRSGGTNRLLADGALLVRDARDVLDGLFGPGRPAPVTAPAAGPGLSPVERVALDALEGGSGDAGAIAAERDISVAKVAAALSSLELAGYLRRGPGGEYTRTALAPPAGPVPDPPNTIGR